MRPRMRKSVVKHLHLNVTQPFARRNRLNLDLDRAVVALPVYQIWLANHAKLLNNKVFDKLLILKITPFHIDHHTVV